MRVCVSVFTSTVNSYFHVGIVVNLSTLFLRRLRPTWDVCMYLCAVYVGGGGEGVVSWVNLKCRGGVLIWIIAGQGLLYLQ